MSLELTSLPLGYIAGALSILSPCVLPLVPMVMAAAATSGRSGPWLLAAGLSLSFAVAGTALSYVLLNIGMGLESVRYPAAAVMLIFAALLLSPVLSDRLSLFLSRFTGRMNLPGTGDAIRPSGQFVVGALLGLVWLPCVGPTLGAAIALASLGQEMLFAFAVMLSFGLGTSSALVAVGLGAGKLLTRWRGNILSGANHGKKLLGVLLLVLGLMVLTGIDKLLEAWALTWLPAWAISI